MARRKIALNLYYLLIVTCTLAKAKLAQINSDIPIAGGRSIAECITGSRPAYWDSDLYTTTTEFARKLGYKAEDHVVVTEDGYILTVHRIVGPDGAPPVFLQHGLFGSSFNFATMNKSLAFMLVENGYDVWLSNSRGSMYSRCHTHYTTADKEYWNFSWHEMGFFDSPAQITYITNITKQDIIFVGYSMGAIISYVMAIERPDAASKVKVLLNLAPSAYYYYSKDLFNLLVPVTRIIEWLTKMTSGEFVIPKNAVNYVCTLTMMQKKICATASFLFYGFDYEQFPYVNNNDEDIKNDSNLPYKLGIHYLHEKITGRFMKYNYGKTGNLKMYNSTEAPSYNISKINVPVGVFWSENDYMAVPKDVLKFYKQVPNQILNYKVKNLKFNHLDFAFGKDAPKYVYSKLLSVMKDFK